MCTVRLRFSAEHLTSQKGKGSKSQYKVPCRLIHHVHVIVVIKTSIIEVPSVQRCNKQCLAESTSLSWIQNANRNNPVFRCFVFIPLDSASFPSKHDASRLGMWWGGAAAAARSRRSRTGELAKFKKKNMRWVLWWAPCGRPCRSRTPGQRWHRRDRKWCAPSANRPQTPQPPNLNLHKLMMHIPLMTYKYHIKAHSTHIKSHTSPKMETSKWWRGAK